MNIRISGIAAYLFFHVGDSLFHHLHLLTKAFLVISQVVHILLKSAIQCFIVCDGFVNIFLELIKVICEDGFYVFQVSFYFFVCITILSNNFLNPTLNTSKVFKLDAIYSFMEPYYFSRISSFSFMF